MNLNEEKILELLREKFETENITRETRFKEDLKADSIDLFQMLIEIEDEYGYTLEDEDAMKIKKVDDLIKIFENK